jgi:hypothetical protein
MALVDTTPVLPLAGTLDGTEKVPVIGTDGIPVQTTSQAIADLAGAGGTPLPVAQGGTGASTLTDHGVLLGSGTAAVTATAAMTNGQLLIGATGADPAPQTVGGDATLAANGTLTIANDAVTTGKIIDGAVTAAKFGSLVAPIQILRQRIQHSDLTAAAISEAIAITGFPANSIPLGAVAEVDTAFSGGGSASVTVEVGDAGGTSELFSGVEVFTGASGFVQGNVGALAGAWKLEAAYAPIATFTSDVNVDTLTAGDLYIHIYYVTPSAATA